jgi:16S rRNA (cytosine1402-N4)-methyltransferase
VSLYLRAAETPVSERTESAAGFHDPVLAREVMEFLAPSGHGLYLDGTVGGGGHSAILLAECPACRVIAVDRDPDALEAARAALAEFGTRVQFIGARFDEALPAADLSEPLAGVLLDLGVSSHQLDSDRRGFTFREGVELDMRMDATQADEPSAAQILNSESEEALARIFHEYGEEPRSRALARAVVERRASKPFRTSDDLVAVLYRTLGRAPRVKEKARIFQALRIAVNEELLCLERGLVEFREAMAPNARIAVISYHSLEDRLVKNAFRDWSRSCVCPPGMPVCTCRGKPLGSVLTRKAVIPSDIEVRRNPRARSARRRVWRKE